MTQTTIRSSTVACAADLEDLSPGSVVHLEGMRNPIYLESSGDWMSTRVPGKPVYDYVADENHYPGTVIFRAEPLEV